MSAKTADSLTIRVGDEKTPITLTDSAVEAVQGEANGNMIEALSCLWAVEETVKGGET